jgi:serine/threonine-protein kinase PknG
MVEMPTVPERDPKAMVLENPEVPEKRRFCGRCDHPVGRPRGPRPARAEGFCPHCGARYSFTPKLRAGDLVAGQYLVAGCVAHGGLGWIYLAQDLNLDGAWMVLKGLLDSGDESAMAAALAEKRFLIGMRHPNIVRIYNFVQHEGAGYIVMEYVGGLSLRDVRLQHKEETGAPLSVQQAIGYVLGILPALEYLHDRDLLFCDFKPDNVIQTEDHLTLIDLGGVRHVGDSDSDLYGTIGYQAPEASPENVSVASDLYTVGRTLAVLSLDVAGFQDENRYATKLPPLREVSAFQRYEPFYRFLQKATAADPAARFQTAAEMADQLHGVLRQVVALDGGSPVAAASTLFSAELGASAEKGAWQLLPVPAIDPSDSAASVLATAALLGADQRKALLMSTPRSPELSLAVARFAIDEGEFEEAGRELDSREARASGWRAAWWRGILHLAENRPADALAFFEPVAAELPGELAPKLAIATCFERCALEGSESSTAPDVACRPTPQVTDQMHQASRYYTLVATTDSGYAGAAFGLARVTAALDDREGAVAALGRVPQSSTSYRLAQIALCAVHCAPLHDQLPGLQDLIASSTTLDALEIESSVRLPLLLDLHTHALRMLLDGGITHREGQLVGGAELTEHGQRSALERTYRSLARLARTEEERCALIDRANQCRPRTLT